MEKLSKEEREQCLALWGCIPTDSDWIRDSKLFQTGNDYSTGYVSPEERARRITLHLFLKDKGINYQ